MSVYNLISYLWTNSVQFIVKSECTRITINVRGVELSWDYPYRSKSYWYRVPVPIPSSYIYCFYCATDSIFSRVSLVDLYPKVVTIGGLKYEDNTTSIHSQFLDIMYKYPTGSIVRFIGHIFSRQIPDKGPLWVVYISLA